MDQNSAFRSLFVLLFGVGAVSLLETPVHHDNAWLLYAAGRVLDGARLYADVIEVNPPLIVMLVLPVVALARVVGIWEVTVFRLSVVALAALSLWLCNRHLRSAGASVPAARLFLVALGGIYLFLPALEYGQREHLMLMLCTPYFLAAAARHSGARMELPLALLTGALGGIGLLLKPHFVPLLIATELLVRPRPRWLWWRPELAVVIGLGVAYAICLVTIASDYLLVARWATSVYGSYYPSSPARIATSRGAVFAAATLAACLAFRPRAGASLIRLIFGAATAVLTMAVFIQNKNWNYHWLAVYGAGIMVWAAIAVDVLGWWRAPTAHAAAPGGANRWRSPVFVLLAVLLVTLAAGLLHTRSAARALLAFQEREYGVATLLELVEREGTERGIYFFSTSMLPAFPLVTYTGVPWASRFNCLWPLPGLSEPTTPGTRSFDYHSRAEMDPVERYLFDSTVQDLLHARPSLLFVDLAVPGNLLHGFDYLAYFSADPRFRELLAEYEITDRVGRFVVLRRTAGRTANAGT